MASFLDLIQQGTSEKVAIAVNFVSAFITGIILAYTKSWRLALAMSSMLPCIGITGAAMNKFISKYMQCVFSSTLISCFVESYQAFPKVRC